MILYNLQRYVSTDVQRTRNNPPTKLRIHFHITYRGDIHDMYDKIKRTIRGIIPRRLFVLVIFAYEHEHHSLPMNTNYFSVQRISIAPISPALQFFIFFPLTSQRPRFNRPEIPISRRLAQAVLYHLQRHTTYDETIHLGSPRLRIQFCLTHNGDIQGIYNIIKAMVRSLMPSRMFTLIIHACEIHNGIIEPIRINNFTVTTIIHG